MVFDGYIPYQSRIVLLIYSSLFHMLKLVFYVFFPQRKCCETNWDVFMPFDRCSIWSRSKFTCLSISINCIEPGCHFHWFLYNNRVLDFFSSAPTSSFRNEELHCFWWKNWYKCSAVNLASNFLICNKLIEKGVNIRISDRF